MNEALVALRDRLRTRCALINARHELPTDQPDIIPDHLRRYVEPIIENWEANAPPRRPRDVAGCTPDQIGEIGRAQGVKLPELYREFLSLMGRSAADLDVGTEWLHPSLVGLKQAAVELLAEWHDPFALPPGALVVAMHQGYQFTWLDTDDGPDPAVWHWVESRALPTRPEHSRWIDYLLHRESYLRDPY